MKYPWQQNQWTQLTNLLVNNKMPHALLFDGLAGLGKFDFAKSLANNFICQNVDKQANACGRCSECVLYAAGNHPDVCIVEPEDKTIKIEQIRALILNLQQTSQRGTAKVVIIPDAHNMNIASSNALLKMLEEPPAGCYFILISSQSQDILPTIRSRCQTVSFAATSEQALLWLKETIKLDDALEIDAKQLSILIELFDNAPLRVLDCIKNNEHEVRVQFLKGFLALRNNNWQACQTLIADCMNSELEIIIFFCFSLICDIQRYQLTRDTNSIVNQDFSNEIIRVSNVISELTVQTMLDNLLQVKTNMLNNINTQMQLESLIIGWLKGFEKRVTHETNLS